MPFHSVPNHHRHLHNTLSHRKRKSRTHRMNNTNEVLQNCPPFNIPSVSCNIIYVHRFTDVHTFDAVIEHFRSCRLYSIRTKSSINSSNLSLIQIDIIPISLPSYMLFVQLHQLLSLNSLLFSKIQLLFQLSFSSKNVLYSWGKIANCT